MNQKSTVFSLLTLLALGLTFYACNDHLTAPADGKISFVSTLSGAGEKPTSVSTAASGTFVGELDRATRVLSYTVTYSGITPTAGHLHRINAANGTGPVEIPFPSVASSPIIGRATLTTTTRVDSLINGFYYVNLHTPAYPGGEIRGNVRVNGPIKLKAILNGAGEKPAPTPSAATGTFAGIVDPSTRVLSYTVTYSGITPAMGHLHRVNNTTTGTGPVEIPFASVASSPIIGTTTLTTNGRLDSLFNGYYYANLHTPAYPGGEIRGDIK